MALLHVHFFSDVLRTNVNCEVILPQKNRSLIGMETTRKEGFRTLYLLHGHSDDCTIWQRRTSIERYVAPLGMAVVMPSALNSWYTDSVHGGKYYTYIAEELPRTMRMFFNGMSDRREDNYIAGLSMGGYGAIKIGLRNCESYAGIAAFSGAYDVYSRAKANKDGYWADLFGGCENIPGSENDLFYLAKKAKDEGKPLPSICMWCGTEDRLLGESRKMRDVLNENGYDLEYSESPGGHSWDRWDEQIQKALDFFDKLGKQN